MIDIIEKANKGDVFAQKQLGLLYARSEDTLKEGIAWLEKAALTDADAMYLLGKIYVTKLNDKEKGFIWIEKAALNNHVDAMIDVGVFYMFGYYVEKDKNKAVEWYKKAAEHKSPVGFHNLGFTYWLDNMQNEAHDFFLKGAEAGYADSAYMLGVMCYLENDSVENKKKALEYFILSYNLGKHYSCRIIGDFYLKNALSNGNNCIDAVDWYLKGMEHNVESCIEALGDCYYFGFGVDEDFPLAYDFYKTATDKGVARTAYMLGLMCASGEGVKKSYSEALKWMRIAESRNYAEAAKYVEMLERNISNNGPATATVGRGGSSGVKIRKSYSQSVEVLNAEQRLQDEERRKKSESIYAAAGAISGSGSFADYEMGAVISPNGEVTYVDVDMGIIMNSNGNVASHDAKSGITYNWSTGDVMMYDEAFGATLEMGTASVKYHHNGYTL